MWLLHDWRSAMVVDEHGRVLDQAVWAGVEDVEAIVSRLRTVGHGGLAPEAQRLLDRFPEARPGAHGMPGSPNVAAPPMSAELMARMDEAALVLAERSVQEAASDPDRRLEHLLHASEELRASWLTMESRLVEWIASLLPHARTDEARSDLPQRVATSESIRELSMRFDLSEASVPPEPTEWSVVRAWGVMLVDLLERIEQIESEVRESSGIHLPSTSLLLGPMLAARLCVAAHGRQRLARLPAGTIQVLGAETAFFHHLRSGAPSPKHGHIFAHPWISRSPRWVRGKIARMLSGRIAIAARLDEFGGQPLTMDAIDEISARVEAIRAAHPSRARS